MLNDMTVNVEIKRIELCDLLLATLAAQKCANDGGMKWMRLHDKLKNILDEFDKEQGY